MTRVALFMLVVFLLPFLGWWLARVFGAVAPDAVMPVPRLAVIGGILSVIGTTAFAVLTLESSDPNARYQPPVLEGGEVSPGRFENDNPGPARDGTSPGA